LVVFTLGKRNASASKSLGRVGLQIHFTGLIWRLFSEGPQTLRRQKITRVCSNAWGFCDRGLERPGFALGGKTPMAQDFARAPTRTLPREGKACGEGRDKSPFRHREENFFWGLHARSPGARERGGLSCAGGRGTWDREQKAHPLCRGVGVYPSVNAPAGKRGESWIFLSGKGRRDPHEAGCRSSRRSPAASAKKKN